MVREIFTCTDDAIERCASVIKSGGILVYPTDTIYGIGCDPHIDRAVKRIFAIKGRDEKKPLPVLAYSMADAEKLVVIGNAGKILTKMYWPGALTIVAPIRDNKISRKVTAGGSSLAVRIPANKCVLSLLKLCRYLVGTSANLAGSMPPKSAQEVLESRLEGYDALLDGGPVEKGVESTVVDIVDKPKVLREGAIKTSEVMELLGQF